MLGSCEKCINIGEEQDVALLHLELQVDLLDYVVRFPKGNLVRSWLGNRAEVMRRGP